MRLFKRAMAFTLASVMTIGITGVVSARVADGTNILQGLAGKWTSYSVCTQDDIDQVHAQIDPKTGKPKLTWRESLEAIRSEKWPNGQVYGVDFATEGWITAQSATTIAPTLTDFDYFVKSTGWDADYNPLTNEIANDNPWGLTATLEDIPVEAGRTYTISFDVTSTLKADKKDEKGKKIGVNTVKHILFKPYEKSDGDPGLDMMSTSNISADGYMTLDSTKGTTKVSAVIKIKDDYKAGKIGLKFAMGALMKTYPEEVALSGMVSIRNFAITANKQYVVNFVSQNKTVSTKYVNEGDKVEKFEAKRKGYTLAGYKNGGATWNFNSLVAGDMNLVAQWTKTKAPAKAKIASVKSTSAKKAVVSIKKMKKVQGYAVQYSEKTNFKGAKQVTSKKPKITIKKLKSGSIVYVRAKAYVTDSAGNKVLGKKWSAKKLVVVK